MKSSTLILFTTTLLLFTAASETKAADRAPWTTSRIQGTPFPPAPFSIRSAFPNLKLNRPTCIEEIPGANRLIITEIGGKIHSLPNNATTTQADLVIDLATITGSSATAFDTEFHPRFAENRFIFVCYNHPGRERQTQVSRFVLSETTPPKILPATEKVIISWPSGGHNGGCLEFGEKEYLYISTGDGSGPNPPDARTTGQDVSDLFGAILRLDINNPEAGKGYRVPSDNPFVTMETARPEIWAYGYRNPWKIGVDPVTGDCYAADNGWESWELIHRAERGSNGGWPIMEGPDLLRSEVTPGPTPIIPAFKAHPHTEANSVIGGPVYQGNRYPELKGWFIYGDYITGTIWAVKPKPDGSTDFQTLADTDLRLSSLTEGTVGRIYLIDYDSTEQIYELIPNQTKASKQQPFPTQLSDTGIFSSLATLKPMPGVTPYQVTVEGWMDGAQAQRWIGIPGSATVHLGSINTPSEFPDGTVLIKHLELPALNNSQRARLETQLLHLEDKRWRPYSYLWDADGKEATLADPTGIDQPLDSPDPSSAKHPQSWHVSAQNECRLCHNADAGFILGFTANQLQKQLESLAAQNVITTAPSVAPTEQLVNPHDPSQPLSDRARSYLHSNCAMCHRPGGSQIASFFLRRDLSFEELRTNKGTGVGTFGIRNAKVVANGDPFRSVLMYRMSKLGYSRMPYIGTRSVDSAGVSLIADWIRSLPPGTDDTPVTSSPNASDSAETKALKRLKQNGNAPAEAAQALIASTEGALALVAALHRGQLSTEGAAHAIAVGSDSSDPNIRGLFETFVPENARKSRLGSQINPNIILRLTGNAKKGKTIFNSAGALCKNCHHPTDKNLSLGTTLVEISQKYPRRSELLRHILEPSLRIDEPYRNYTLELTDGTTLNGLIANENDTSYRIKTAELEEYDIPKAEVRERRPSELSPMPAGVLSDLGAQDAADLLAFLESFRAGE